MSTLSLSELEEKLEEVYAGPGFDMTDKVAVFKATCPSCSWRIVSWSDEVSLMCLIEHMRMEHKEELLEIIKGYDNFDQVVLDMLTKPPVNFGRQLLHKNISAWVVPVEVWVSLPDVVTK